MTANARRPLRLSKRLAPLRPIVALLVVVIVIAMLAPSVSAVLAPFAAVPLLVGWWLLGFGAALTLPFAVIAAVTVVIER